MLCSPPCLVFLPRQFAVGVLHAFLMCRPYLGCCVRPLGLSPSPACLRSCLPSGLPACLGCRVRTLGLSPKFHVRFEQLFGVFGGYMTNFPNPYSHLMLDLTSPWFPWTLLLSVHCFTVVRTKTCSNKEKEHNHMRVKPESTASCIFGRLRPKAKPKSCDDLGIWHAIYLHNPLQILHWMNISFHLCVYALYIIGSTYFKWHLGLS